MDLINIKPRQVQCINAICSEFGNAILNDQPEPRCTECGHRLITIIRRLIEDDESKWAG